VSSIVVLLIVLVAVPACLGLVWTVAYRVGFNEGRLTLPLRLIHALAEHEVGCRGLEPDRVVRDLVRVLALPERESRHLVASKVRSVAPSAPRTLRSA
jgi:hypothetical protein